MVGQQFRATALISHTYMPELSALTILCRFNTAVPCRVLPRELVGSVLLPHATDLR